ncbi:MAG: FtsW/RodA/SpoVE family cell cycle protein [Actinomycetaceae bacterium]|nr:FtsW/RodA/SpoVE family cell cycle protein [Actinomycetaceae bacterium]
MATVQIHQARSGRLPEVVLLALAILLGMGGYLATTINKTGSLPHAMWIHLGVLVAIALITHLLVRHFAPYADPVILPIAVALNGIGLAMIYRLDSSYRMLGRTGLVVGTKQLVITLAGIMSMAFVLAFVKDHKRLRRYSYICMVMSIIILLLPIFFPAVNGAKIWINLGFITLQPSEFAKILLAVFFSAYLVDNRDKLSVGGPKISGIHLPRIRDLGPLMIVWALAIAVLVFQHDFGTSLLLFGMFVSMIYVATNRVSWLVIGAILILPGLWAATKVNHVAQRFEGWLHALDPEIYNKVGGSGQLVQGLFGMATGGLFGTGWGSGYPQLVPFANSDFIFSSLAEELGLTGVLAILLCYLILVERGIRTAIGVRDGFGKLLATGLSFAIAFQVFVVVGGLTRVLPLTGLTAPFLAAGGSSLLSSWIIVGLMLRISDLARRPSESTPLLSTNEINKLPLSGENTPKNTSGLPPRSGHTAADHNVTEWVPGVNQ